MTARTPTVAVLDAMPAASLRVIEEIFTPAYALAAADDGTPAAKRVAARDADVLLTMWGSVDADTIAAAPHARVIQKLGVGVDKIDATAAAARGVVVLKAAGINADAVAELAVLLTLAVGRHYDKATAAARKGLLAKEELRAESFQLLGRRYGLLGFGAIGRAVATRMAGFGVEIVYYDLAPVDPAVERACHARYVEQDELIGTADVISLHLPSTPGTDRIVDESFLARTKPGVIIVNTARGSLIDEPALARAVASGQVLGAGLDVTAQEPIAADSPLLGLERVVLTPHVGGAVADNFPRVIRRAYDNAEAVLHGGSVDPADVVVWPGR
ncbi:MAG TPA: NAD(P)-dependent oxidoreductase [Mycobacteriales bacterium]|nr:NAD(P)-dependent oxidoreductase [Mycobacteriales bacterium]